MARFLIRRLTFALVLLVCTSSAALFLTRLAPGDVTSQLGAFAPRAEVEAARTRFGLDRNPVVQWGQWISRAVRLDFGDSFLYNRPVGPIVVEAAGKTALLAASALVVSTLLGLGLGVFTGSRRAGWLSACVRGASVMFISVPPLLMSLILVFIAARTRWLPTGGMLSATTVDASWTESLADVAWHLVLPTLALALPIAAAFERLQSQSMSEAVRQPFLLAAIARGVERRELVWRHAWPVSIRPICGVYGLVIGSLLSGSFIVEYITAWPGIGRLMYEALRARDIYLVSACAAAGAGFLAFGTLLGDVLLAVADPRVREDIEA
jgi:peptide/nickel transport system permease protein